MPKNSPTTDHLSAQRFQDGTRAVPSWVVNHPTFVPRLSWRVATSLSASVNDVAESLGRHDVAVFADTSIFNDGLNQEQLWLPILDGIATVMLTSQVIHESIAYLTERKGSHPIARAVDAHHPRVVFGADIAILGNAIAAQDYYLTLLAARRHASQLFAASQAKRTGRQSSTVDAIRLTEAVQREFGNRAIKLEKKANSSNTLTDEQLVFAATEHALRTGQESIILTQDWDVEEQFFKMLWLLDTHYRSMLLGRLYRHDFIRFHPHTIPDRKAEHLFVGKNNVWFERNADLRFVLPKSFTFVAINVTRITNRITRLTFGAEQGMYEVLRMKASTGGNNTDQLGSRNVHCSVGALSLSSDGSDVAAVVHDRKLPTFANRSQVAVLDVLQALYSAERHRSSVGHSSTVAMDPSVLMDEDIGHYVPEPIRHGRLWLPYGVQM